MSNDPSKKVCKYALKDKTSSKNSFDLKARGKKISKIEVSSQNNKEECLLLLERNIDIQNKRRRAKIDKKLKVIELSFVINNLSNLTCKRTSLKEIQSFIASAKDKNESFKVLLNENNNVSNKGDTFTIDSLQTKFMTIQAIRRN